MADGSDIPTLDALLAAMNAPLDDVEYYCMTLTADSNRTIHRSSQTEWVGWEDQKKGWERRQPRLVDPLFMHNNWTDVQKQPYAVINSADELAIFMVSGGNSLIESTVAGQHLQDFLETHVSIPHGPSGFKSITAFDKSAFRRAPTQKLRMRVLKRDDRRCRICGRRPENDVDLELHVHHIRPWGEGGITDACNLITLCHTCHKGLDPHRDLSLFEYLFPGSTEDAIEREYNELLSGVQHSRGIILDLVLPDDPDA